MEIVDDFRKVEVGKCAYSSLMGSTSSKILILPSISAPN